MRFTKPAWVAHQEGTKSENVKHLPIFSVHVHPDGSRIATGGLDAKIRIWSTKPILNQSSELANKPPKSLCTLSMHTGPVLTVRWAHSGRWLASGSDDSIVMIWDLDPHGSGRVWGSDEVNVEGWKPLKRLVGHESDVTDIAWSPEDRYLASTGLDSKVFIWCGFTLERLAKLDLHQGFVKGVCWDPVGEYLATASDDRSVNIWRTTDWGLEACVTKPFEHSPGSTFFRRLSWSPDGAHITASNATNNNGYVFTAAVITRSTWTSEISLVGHENTVEVASYNPHIFLRDPSMPVVTANICSVVALGADDLSVSVWQTKSARPLIAAKEVFERPILDLNWSWDGLTLYAVSSDGTLGVFNFDKDELEGISPRNSQEVYLQKFGFIPPPLPSGYTHTPALMQSNGHSVTAGDGNAGRSTPPLTPPRQQPTMTNGFGSTQGLGSERVNTLIARKGCKNKKRVQPTFVGTLGASGSSVPSSGSVPSSNVTARFAQSSSVQLGDAVDTVPTSATYGRRFESAMDLDLEGNYDRAFEGGMDMNVPIDSLDASSHRGTVDDVKIPKARTLGGDRVRNIGDPEMREIKVVPRAEVVNAVAGSSTTLNFPPLSLKTYFSVKVEDTGDILEAKNSEDVNEPTEVSFQSSKDKSVQWLDYLPSRVTALAGTTRFCAVAMEDGTVNVYSNTGRRLMPSMSLGLPISYFDASKHFLMAITSSGFLHVWNVKTMSAQHPPASLSPLSSFLATTAPTLEHPNGLTPSITQITVRPNGACLVHISNGLAMSYDKNLMSWVRVGDVWWASGSSCWKARTRTSSVAFSNLLNNASSSAANGIVASVEARISETVSASATQSEAEKKRPSWWTPALTLGHLETRMHAAKMLESAAEYRQSLLLYARTIADEGFRAKADELLRELYGPVYWRPGKVEDSWIPSILGIQKRDLAKEVLIIFARSKTLFKLAQEYQELLKKSSLED